MRLWLFLAFGLTTWLHRLGGPGLLLVGIIDNSVIPLPGSQDAFTILLASGHRAWWPFYGAMSTAGAVLGGFLTYRLAKKGGKETLEKRVGKKRAEKVYKRFEKHGFSTIVIGSVLPPPFPIVPVLMAPGVLQYPRKKFLAALTLGRGLRFFADAYIAHIYGKVILGFFGRYKTPVLYGLIALAVLGGIAALLYFQFYRPKRRAQERAAGEPVEELPVPGQENQELKKSRADKGEDASSEEHPAEEHPHRKTA